MEKDIDYIVRRLKEIYGNKVEIEYKKTEQKYIMTIKQKRDEETSIENVLYITRDFKSVGNIICEASKIIDNFLKI